MDDIRQEGLEREPNFKLNEKTEIKFPKQEIGHMGQGIYDLLSSWKNEQCMNNS